MTDSSNETNTHCSTNLEEDFSLSVMDSETMGVKQEFSVRLIIRPEFFRIDNHDAVKMWVFSLNCYNTMLSVVEVSCTVEAFLYELLTRSAVYVKPFYGSGCENASITVHLQGDSTSFENFIAENEMGAITALFLNRETLASATVHMDQVPVRNPYASDDESSE